eukprot:scaffold12410_cov56-Phaeocystis_antarctica.AAC.2
MLRQHDCTDSVASDGGGGGAGEAEQDEQAGEACAVAAPGAERAWPPKVCRGGESADREYLLCGGKLRYEKVDPSRVSALACYRAEWWMLFSPIGARGAGGGCSERANMWGDIWRNVARVPAWQLASFLNSLSGGA